MHLQLHKGKSLYITILPFVSMALLVMRIMMLMVMLMMTVMIIMIMMIIVIFLCLACVLIDTQYSFICPCPIVIFSL